MDRGVFAVVGPGRAGSALTEALVARGWTLTRVAGRDPERAARLAGRHGAEVVQVERAGRDADLVVVATPDDVLATVAGRLAPSLRPGAVVVHLSGASGLDVLAPISARSDVTVGSLHPLQTLPEGSGADRLAGAWCAVEGPLVDLATSLGMHPVVVAPSQRPTYHAAATIASNHVVALLGQVQRLADAAGVPFDAFVPLVRTTLDNVASDGARRALTGPVARGDVSTVAAHLDALPGEERDAYRALARAAATLSARDDAALAALLEEQPA